MRRSILSAVIVAGVACVPLIFHAMTGLEAHGQIAPNPGKLPQYSVWNAADPPPAAPGAGHGFLIDAHVAAGLTCKSCHTTMPYQPASMATCLTCHGGTYQRLAAMTASDNPNPHQSHQGDVPCAACHHVHMASENYCSQCHTNFNFKVP